MNAHPKFGPAGGGSYLARARDRWGDMPDWVQALARAADGAPSLTAVSQRVGLPSSTLSAILGNKYPGRTDKVAAKLRGALMGEVVECPATGTRIGRDDCARNQAKKFSSASPLAAKFPRACKGCPNAIGGE